MSAGPWLGAVRLAASLVGGADRAVAVDAQTVGAGRRPDARSCAEPPTARRERPISPAAPVDVRGGAVRGSVRRCAGGQVGPRRRGGTDDPPRRCPSRPSAWPSVAAARSARSSSASSADAVARARRRSPPPSPGTSPAGRPPSWSTSTGRPAGIDVLLGLEAADGVRWPDLADARGEVSGADVLALLPRWGACAVLSADRARPGAPEPAVVADVLHALTTEAGALVLDLDRGGRRGGGVAGRRRATPCSSSRRATCGPSPGSSRCARTSAHRPPRPGSSSAVRRPVACGAAELSRRGRPADPGDPRHRPWAARRPRARRCAGRPAATARSAARVVGALQRALA